MTFPRVAVLPLLLLLALSTGRAQAPAESEIRVSIDPFPQPIVPLAGMGTTNATVRIPCALAVPGADRPAAARFWFEEKPPWVVATLSPVAVPVSPQRCQGAEIVERVTLHVTTTALAPAFDPAALRLAASLEGPTGNRTGRGTTSVEAGFFGILSALAERPAQAGEPQTPLVYPILVENHGNADVRVTFKVVNHTPGFVVVEPAPVVLESSQGGGGQTAVRVNVLVHTPYRNGFVNEAGTVTLAVTSQTAKEPVLPGDSATLSFVATAKGFYVPGPATALALLAVAAVAFAAGRGGRPPGPSRRHS